MDMAKFDRRFAVRFAGRSGSHARCARKNWRARTRLTHQPAQSSSSCANLRKGLALNCRERYKRRESLEFRKVTTRWPKDVATNATAGVPPTGASSSLWNKDLAPIPLDHRTWGTYNYTALWVAMSVNIPTYLMASAMIAGGMNWKQALFTVFLGNVIVLIPMLLNAHAGAEYGIPFPVFARSSFGVLGANIPAVLRALGRLRLVRYPDLDRRRGDQHVTRSGHSRLESRLALLLLVLGIKRDRNPSRNRHDSLSAGNHRARAVDSRPCDALVGLLERGRPRANAFRSVEIPNLRGILCILHSVAHGRCCVLGHRRVEHS